MKKKTPPKDVNVNAFEILQALTGEAADLSHNETSLPKKKKSDRPEKNPAAVALGRLGGKKGGPARAKKLSPQKRKAIARLAAKVRWEVDR
ncbi:MAG: hypothetical protein LZF86_10018 [Nitrospira sp.]|nr:MAG: hypothetical protein LZF86_10018 [Nitrospira sp.]